MRRNLRRLVWFGLVITVVVVGLAIAVKKPQQTTQNNMETAGEGTTEEFLAVVQHGIRVYRDTDGNLRAILPGNRSKNIGHGDVAFLSPTKAYVASLEEGLRLLDIESGKSIQVMPPGSLLTGIELSPDGRHLAYAVPDQASESIDPETVSSGGIGVLDTSTGEEKTIFMSQSVVYLYGWHNNEELVVEIQKGGAEEVPPQLSLLSLNGMVRPWSDVVKQLHFSTVYPKRSPDGKYYAFEDPTGVAVVNLRTGAVTRTSSVRDVRWTEKGLEGLRNGAAIEIPIQ